MSSAFDAAREIDPEYALELERAAAGGVEILPQAVAPEARPGASKACGA